jgi:hypothetical protein
VGYQRQKGLGLGDLQSNISRTLSYVLEGKCLDLP